MCVAYQSLPLKAQQISESAICLQNKKKTRRRRWTEERAAKSREKKRKNAKDIVVEAIQRN